MYSRTAIVYDITNNIFTNKLPQTRAIPIFGNDLYSLTTDTVIENMNIKAKKLYIKVLVIFLVLQMNQNFHQILPINVHNHLRSFH